MWRSNKRKCPPQEDPDVEIQCTVVVPKQHGDLFTWPGLAVQKSTFGNGVFTTTGIKAGTCIPIFGRKLTEHALRTLITTGQDTHTYVYQKKPEREWAYAVDGRPITNNNGLNIAMMVNEPVSGAPSCIFKWDCLVVAIDVPPGTELTVYYGNINRRKFGYTIDESDAHIEPNLIMSKHVSKQLAGVFTTFYEKAQLQATQQEFEVWEGDVGEKWKGWRVIDSHAKVPIDTTLSYFFNDQPITVDIRSKRSPYTRFGKALKPFGVILSKKQYSKSFKAYERMDGGLHEVKIMYNSNT